jgi:hypothetical protein
MKKMQLFGVIMMSFGLGAVCFAHAPQVITPLATPQPFIIIRMSIPETGNEKTLLCNEAPFNDPTKNNPNNFRPR